ncbi:hypothetical protein [Streptomyces orinoci]|uniref:Uncharacterized protein n=1 Tax=Streptomyces orinoci TaxID=67339 RepID=A0ABV3JPS0_STRON|nr:hypothetical protein [Streptomyces orinoci]
MSDALTFAEMAGPLAALRVLAADFGELPAPTVSVSAVFPNRLELAFHSGFADFERWREALGIAPANVGYRVLDNGRTGVVRVLVPCGGAELELVGYADISPAVLVGGAA